MKSLGSSGGKEHCIFCYCDDIRSMFIVGEIQHRNTTIIKNDFIKAQYEKASIQQQKRI